MKVVLDTNIILSSIAYQSKNAIIIDKLMLQEFELVISTEILLEYEEKITQIFSKIVAENFINALLLLPNVIRQEPLFKSSIIKDADDNKFLDVYYASQSNYLITNDKDFDILNKIKFPKHNLLKIQDFIELLVTIDQ